MQTTLVRTFVLGVLLSAVVVCGCGSPPKVRSDSYLWAREICHVVRPEHTVTAYSTDRGVRYSVFSRDGHTVVDKVSREELRARRPKVYEANEDLFAELDGGGDPSNYAGLSNPEAVEGSTHDTARVPR